MNSNLFKLFLTVQLSFGFLFGVGPMRLTAAESGRFVSVSPSTFTGGQATTVTVRVQNTGDSDDMIIEADSWPSGWSVSPRNRNPYIASGNSYSATFTVTPPVAGGSGTIVWKFYDDDPGIHPAGSDLLATFPQSVSASLPNRKPTQPGALGSSSVTATSASVSWSASTDPDGDAITYEVQYGKTFALDGWTSAGSTSGTSRIISNLASDTTYTVRVRATDNKGGESDWRVASGLFKTLPANRRPTPPGGISSSSPTSSGATVSWGAATDPDGDAITYEVQYGKTFALDGWTSAGSASGTSRTISNLASDTTYTVRVRATDNKGGESDWRVASGLFKTLPANRAPTQPGTLSSSSVTATSASVSWGTSSDPDGDPITYEIQFGKTFALDGWTSADTTSGTSHTISNLASDTTYTVRVRATDSKGLAGEWREASGLFKTLLSNRPPTRPGTINSSNWTSTGATVSWGASSDPDGHPISYEVEYKTDFSLVWGSTLTTTGTSIILTGLSPGTVYDVRVRARDNALLYSDWRDQENVITTLTITTFGGIVTDALTGAPVSGASVSWGSQSTTTSGAGIYHFSNLSCNAAIITISKSGYQTFTESYSPTCNASSQKNVPLIPGTTRLSVLSGNAPWYSGSETTPVYISLYGEPGGRIEPGRRTWIVIHGRLNSSSDDEILNLASAIKSQMPGDQVLTLDWSVAAVETALYGGTSAGERWIQPVGAWAAAKLAEYGFYGSYLNLVGHSWGSCVADEIAERVPNGLLIGATGVNSIVGLDPAANTWAYGGGHYNPNDDVDFTSHSVWSWAFHSSNLFGSEAAAATAREAFVVDINSFDPVKDHGNIRNVFSNMLLNPNGGLSKYFQLKNLITPPVRPWIFNQFNGDGDGVGKYEAYVTINSDRVTPKSISYISTNTLQLRTEFEATEATPEIQVTGGGGQINDGDNLASISDGTDFGSVDVANDTAVQTFVIANSGPAPLNLTGSPRVQITGTGSSDFVVVSQPSTPISANGGTATFQIRFDPSAIGLRAATVSIPNDDSDENPYNFAIQGTGTSAPTVAQPTITPNGGSFAGSVLVTLACSTPGALIYFTTSGSDPTTSSTSYGGPIPVNSTVTVKARAFKTGYDASPIATASFIVSPVVDTTPPLLEITSHLNNATVTQSTITLDGTATDGGCGNNGISEVTVTGQRANGDTVTGANTANWSRSVSLNSGLNIIEVIARDNSPNRNAAQTTITVNYVPTGGTNPPNDYFANRVSVGAGFAVTGGNSNATKEDGEPNHPDHPGGKSVWWSWTAIASGTATVSTAGSSFDTLLAVYTGNSISTLSLVASNDDENRDASILTSRVRFAVIAGTVYHIAVDGYDGDAGEIKLLVSLDSGGTVPIVSALPTISVIPDVVTSLNAESQVVSFTVSDEETPAGNLIVQPVASTNPGVAPLSNVRLLPEGGKYYLVIIPGRDQVGESTVTIRVTDRDGMFAERSFKFTVLGANQPPIISQISNVATAPGAAVGPLSFTISDDRTALGFLQISVASSNPSLIPNSNIQIGGTQGERSLLITPVPGRIGEALITLTVADQDGGSTPMSFRVSVGVGPAPELKIEFLAGNLILSWPLSATGYFVESSDNLLIWQRELGTPSAFGGRNAFSPSTTNRTRFYRLRLGP